ncbi:MAG: bifunctional pyr operon transcriptional regulator/uracil phosphoribosyltransferase PyrR [Bacteroidetes bacterium]|nr:MAG: bifunctional pyr operon transcriptional regulator/uracil phosphoribosyltransferase PyrR [Bacteroidota bacterium]
MEKGKVILDQERFALTIERLCYQLIEDFDQFENTCFVGIQPRGTFVSDRIHQRLLELTLLPRIEYGKLDITFYRDDFRIRTTPLRPSPTQMDFLVEDKNVILFDDVLYTGRTVQATLTALQHYGRPKNVRLLALVDRRFNRHLPIRADYVGFRVDALDEAYVKVEWTETEGQDRVLLFPDRKK